MAQALIVTGFNTVGVATRHPHWFKEAEDVEPIVGPLCRIIESMPAGTLKALEKRFNGVALAIGAAVVITPDITEEIRLRRDAATAKKEAAPGRTAAPGYVNGQGAAKSGPGGVPGQSTGQPQPGANGSAAPWGDTLPPPGLHVDY